jgi:transposase
MVFATLVPPVAGSIGVIYLLYTLNYMASIQRKIIHGRPYYYLVESRRVNGRPRPVVVQYLGTADRLLQRLQQPHGEPVRARLAQFGGVAALYDLAQQLRLVELIDQHVPKRHQGPSVGQYLLVASINRCLAPTSKRQMPAWLGTTPLPRWLGLSAQQFSAQRFWDNMELLGEDEISAISEALTRRLLETFQLDVNSLIFDCTNFDTFIDTETPSRLPQRGHAKSKREDLRIVGLALLVSVDFHVPLSWKVYPGNQHDSLSFHQALEELTRRYQVLARDCQSITLVFDKGNNSASNQEILDASGFHFVGSLVPTHYSDLLAIPLKKFEPLNDVRLQPVQALRLSREVWGQERTLVVTFSSELQRKQIRGIEQHLGKKRRALEELQARLRRSQMPGARGKGYTRESLEKQVKEICSGQHIARILHVAVTEQGKNLKLTYHTDAAAFARIKQQLGKRILFTDQKDWSNEQIVLSYRSQSHVEDAFRSMKDPHFLGWEPMFHWTDSKIRVHALYCVLALTMGSLLQRRAANNGLALSMQTLFKALSGIQEVTNLFPAAGKPGSPGRPQLKTTLTEMDPTQQALYRLFALDSYRQA